MGSAQGRRRRLAAAPVRARLPASAGSGGPETEEQPFVRTRDRALPVLLLLPGPQLIAPCILSPILRSFCAFHSQYLIFCGPGPYMPWLLHSCSPTTVLRLPLVRLSWLASLPSREMHRGEGNMRMPPPPLSAQPSWQPAPVVHYHPSLCCILWFTEALQKPWKNCGRDVEKVQRVYSARSQGTGVVRSALKSNRQSVEVTGCIH